MAPKKAAKPASRAAAMKKQPKAKAKAKAKVGGNVHKRPAGHQQSKRPTATPSETSAPLLKRLRQQDGPALAADSSRSGTTSPMTPQGPLNSNLNVALAATPSNLQVELWLQKQRAENLQANLEKTELQLTRAEASRERLICELLASRQRLVGELFELMKEVCSRPSQGSIEEQMFRRGLQSKVEQVANDESASTKGQEFGVLLDEVPPTNFGVITDCDTEVTSAASEVSAQPANPAHLAPFSHCAVRRPKPQLSF
eukprot:gnl/TRDRNA2_/TRDRNA2_172843_c0_seq1.p1 gnl/TRDRNA2_/TRDRNA2_172843_c0~~gnl/TRDRNA2_/TRDRNA2_172843_c0_seq1.p1  ORF type:complete len:256 (-),score=49.30 gnl/TRDRNA2_/TRDRNA2_172843_c0_seq1:230-997(-)